VAGKVEENSLPAGPTPGFSAARALMSWCGSETRWNYVFSLGRAMNALGRAEIESQMPRSDPAQYAPDGKAGAGCSPSSSNQTHKSLEPEFGSGGGPRPKQIEGKTRTHASS